MRNLDSILKSKDSTLLTKVCIVKAMVFPVVMYGCESWTIKKAESQRTDAFELWCWRRLLRVPWTVKRSHQSILKEINPEYSLEGLMLKLKLFGHLMWRTDSLEPPLLKMFSPILPRVMNHLHFPSHNWEIPWKKNLLALLCQSLIPPFPVAKLRFSQKPPVMLQLELELQLRTVTFYFLTQVSLDLNSALVSGVSTVIQVFFFCRLYFILCYYNILTIIACVTQ